jgi:hypothetical protein
MTEETQTYYQRNKERQLALAKLYRDKNREKYREYWKAYYQENKQSLLEKRKEYARKNRDRIYQKNRTVYYPRHQAKKKNAPPEPLPEVLSPTVHLPQWTLVVSRGDHLVSFD